MRPLEVMLIAGEASGDLLASGLVRALRTELIHRDPAESLQAQPLRTRLEPRFFGAGGPKMAGAGVELAFDLTQHSVIGFADVLKHYLKFRRLFRQLLLLAVHRQPDVIIGVDFGGFNLRFGHAIRSHIRAHRRLFNNWNPKLVQFVSPQVWASRAGRAYQIAEDYDLLLSIFPFEKRWYSRRVPRLRVAFVGHPLLDRYPTGPVPTCRGAADHSRSAPPRILLLPGSRTRELQRHLPVLLGALDLIRRKFPQALARMVLPNETLASLARSLGAGASRDLEISVGNLAAALREADLAMASTGTVTMECAFFRVPTVTLYKTSPIEFQIARRIVTVTSLTMPNLLSGQTVYPEFVQNAATADNIASAALELLGNPVRRARLNEELDAIIASLGGPGASARAAQEIASLIQS